LLVSASAPALAQLGANFLVSNNGTTAYVINGAQNPTLSWNVNHSYTLQINAPPNHPFRVQTTTGIGGTAYPGCSPQDQITGLITCTAPATGTTLFYQCQNHPAMHGNIMVNDPPTVSAMGRHRALLPAPASPARLIRSRSTGWRPLARRAGAATRPGGGSTPAGDDT
jgi:hypothetical protein